MTRTFYHPDTGLIEGAYVAGSPEQMAALTDAYVGMDCAWLDGPSDPDLHWIVDGDIVNRPDTGLPAEHTLAPGVPWTLPDVPVGTVVAVDGIELATTDEPGLTLSGSQPFTVELRPPFPWRGGTCRVTIE